MSPDGQRLLTGSRDQTSRIYGIPKAVDGSPLRTAVWVRTLCGMQLEGNEAVSLLTPEEWGQECRTLEKLGGPPVLERQGQSRYHPNK
jgi:hypothetical protein